MARIFLLLIIIVFSSFSSAFAKVYDKVDQLDLAFFANLQTCTEGNFNSRYTYAWYIYGKKDGKCSFEQKSSMYNMKCLLPMNVAKKYAQENINMYRTSKQKGFAPGSNYINKVINDKNYCSRTYIHKK